MQHQYPLIAVDSALRQYQQQGSIRGLLVAAGRVLLKPKKLGILDDCRPLVMPRHLQIYDEEVFGLFNLVTQLFWLRH